MVYKLRGQERQHLTGVWQKWRFSAPQTVLWLINKTVEIKGHKVKGYPVEGGPEYIDVSKIK